MIALVTGGTKGIGRAIANGLRFDGYTVIVTYESDDAGASSFLQELGNGPAPVVLKSSITSGEDIDALKDLISDRYGRLDVLVNNAGRIFHPAAWRDVSESDFLSSLHTNLVGHAMLVQRVSGLLERTNNSSIVNISSIYGLFGDGAILAYSTAKAGLIQLTRTLARDLAPRIRVNAVLPGHIDTAMTRAANREFINGVVSRTPLERLGQPEDVAELVRFLVSNKASFLTGQAISLDGGFGLGT